MSSPLTELEPPGLTLSDIYYALFRHKTKILICSLAGLLLAFAVHRLTPPTFESEAKLLIRYVADAKSPALAAGGTTAKSPDQRGETIMDSEIEIITSLDLARRVAEAMGPEKFLGPSTGEPSVKLDLHRAAAVIKGSLKVEIPSRSSVIRLLFKHSNRDLVQPALEELIESYLKLHFEFHRAGGVVEEFLAQETNQFRSRLSQTEEELRKVRKTSGVASLDGTHKTSPELIATIRMQIFAAQAELAERSTLLQQQPKPQVPTAEAPAPPAEPEAEIPVDQVSEYQSVVAQLGMLRKMEQELLTQFHEGNPRVTDIRAQRAIAEANKRAIEERYPGLVRKGSRTTPQSTLSAAKEENEIEPTDAARVSALEAKIKVLKSQLEELLVEAATLEQIEPQITELRRKKDLEEANYRYFSTSLEQARIDEAQAAGQASNISVIQMPSPATLDQKRTRKLIMLLAAGGIIGGLGWAFLIELYLDRTIKRRSDVERIVQPPLFLSIPRFRKKATRQAAKALIEARGATPARKSNGAPALEPYHEALRDQVIGYFEGKGLLRKPKLVTVTGVGSGTGVSTTAAGLARSLSEIGDGNVLLVDMTIGQESARHFIHGEVDYDLNQILDTPNQAQVDGHLYVVAENTQRDRLSSNLPQRFSKLAPKLKASAFEYIIFDLPPISPISITSRLAVFMDLVLIVVHSEKTGYGVFERATALMAQTNVPIGVVLNKTRAYVPSWLHQEFIGES